MSATGPRKIRQSIAAQPWRDRAACAKHPNPLLWDDRVEAGEPDAQRTGRHRQAIRVCRSSCPVLHDCRASVSRRLDEGVRGGTVLPPLDQPEPALDGAA